MITVNRGSLTIDKISEFLSPYGETYFMKEVLFGDQGVSQVMTRFIIKRLKTVLLAVN